jgi:RNA polymerase sigma-70 factor (ECF subfamily)
MGAESMDWDRFDDEVKRAVLDLQPEYRFVLLLWAIEGLTYREIADVCHCAMGTIMSRLYRARQLLGRRLRHYAREHRLIKDYDTP